MNRFSTAFFTIIPSLFIACESEPPVAKIIVTDQKMPLTEWPDSAYIASLDSILVLEPIKKGADAEAKINMNVFDAPVFKLPGSVTGKKEAAPKANHAGKSAGAKQASAPRQTIPPNFLQTGSRPPFPSCSPTPLTQACTRPSPQTKATTCSSC